MILARSPSGSAAATTRAARTSGATRRRASSATCRPDRPSGRGSGNSARPARSSSSRRLAPSMRTIGIPPAAVISRRLTSGLVTPTSMRISSATSSDRAVTSTSGPVSVPTSLSVRRLAMSATRSTSSCSAMYSRTRRVGRSTHGRSSTSTRIGAASAASTRRSRLATAMANGSTSRSTALDGQRRADGRRARRCEVVERGRASRRAARRGPTRRARPRPRRPADGSHACRPPTARTASSSSRVVLPMPASPTTVHAPPCPSAARAVTSSNCSRTS